MTSAWVMLIVPSLVMSLFLAITAGDAPSCSSQLLKHRACFGAWYKAPFTLAALSCAKRVQWASPLAFMPVERAVRHSCLSFLPLVWAQRLEGAHDPVFNVKAICMLNRMAAALLGGHCFAAQEGESQCPPSSGSAPITGLIPVQKCLWELLFQAVHTACIW